MSDGFFEAVRKGLQKFFSNRVLVIGVVIFAAFALLIARLFSLQVLHSDEYSENYMNTTRKEVSIPAQRGNIYDRNGRLLAGNRVVYSVTITDWFYYTKKDGAFNEMLLRLIHLLDRYDAEPKKTVPAEVGPDGLYVFTGSAAKVRTFIRDVYGAKNIEEIREKTGEDPYTYDAETVLGYLMKSLYNFTSRWAGASEVSKEDALKICHIRYALSATSYTRYIETPIVEDITDELQAAVLESQTDLVGVHVEQTFERVYYNSECFSGILGYVGSITTSEIDDLNAQGGHYIAGDVIGKEGIESAYESYLQGSKGRKIIYVNSSGITLYEEIIEEPKQGNDVYLSVDADITIAAYNVIEQRLAGIVQDHLYEDNDYDPEKAYQESAYKIPIRDVYFQMINNSILSIADFSSDEACEAEKRMNTALETRKAEILERSRRYLENRETGKVSALNTYEQAYITYMSSFMSREGYLKSEMIDTEDSVYINWKSRDLSFPTFLMHALENGWIDMSKFDEEQRYNTVDACYAFMTEAILEDMSASYGDFDKLIYDELIHTDRISGCEVGLAMFRQGVIAEDRDWMAKLDNRTNHTAFEFFSAKINSMELLPGQIALDPCSAGLVLTDPNSGNLLAVVTYPGYDSNRINDSAYYSSLLTDMSSPLYSRATQSRLAPGSTFKMVTATAALEGGYVRLNERIKCEGIYDKLDHPRCWIYRAISGEHGYLDIIHALGQSCNCFFYECGYRFSLNENGRYSPALGLSVLHKYAEMYGFGSLTGIETRENVSVISEDLPVTSAIGQGTHAFTTISLARYVTAIASEGNLYDFKLLEHIEDRDGNVLLSRSPEVKSVLNFADTTWERLHEGMFTVVHEGGSRRGDFDDLRYDYAAKSGSAQENRNRPEHGWYVSYGPYDDIKYAMAVQIPNGYSSGNAALISKGLYEYLEGDITLEEILKNSASSGGLNDTLD